MASRASKVALLLVVDKATSLKVQYCLLRYFPLPEPPQSSPSRDKISRKGQADEVKQ